MNEELTNEYDVYYHKYSSSMSDNASDAIDSEKNDEEESSKEAAPVQLDGYTTIFDINVALTPIELVPTINGKY